MWILAIAGHQNTTTAGTGRERQECGGRGRSMVGEAGVWRERQYGTPSVTKIKSLFSGLGHIFPRGYKNARPYIPGAVS